MAVPGPAVAGGPAPTRAERGRHAAARGTNDWGVVRPPRLLRRFRIRGKLNVLLLLALAAVLLVAVPFMAGQVENARSAGRTADAARNAQAIGGLTSELQRERLVTAAYLADPAASDAQLVQQQRIVDSTAADVRSTLGPDASDELEASLVRLGSLQEPRQSALRRGISPDRVARTYQAVIAALVDAPRLVPQDSGDAEGTRQLAALDALLRANEFDAVREVSLIASAVDPQTGLVVLSDASARAPLFTEQFVQQADGRSAALVVQVDQGDGARRIDALADQVTGTPGALPASFVADAFEQSQTQLTARRGVQDQVINQIADAATSRASAARWVALLVAIGAAALFGLIAALAIAVSRSIATPLGQLTSAASRVADLAAAELNRVKSGEASDESVPHLPPIDVATDDELGVLAAAFNRVQATATELVEQHAARRNNDVSVMFANVAQRTQNLVGRQLTLIDELERNEQDGQLLAHLYRLDHLSTRLRRTADDLLVIAGSPADSRIQGPVVLTTALRSALAEIEDYQRVDLQDHSETVLSPELGADAVLLFAELLDNATSFSPPGSGVEVRVEYPADGSCVVRIVDHGIGMSPEQLAEENARLAGHERVHLAPSGVLGLFVVGRLVRRHNLTVQLTETAGGGITASVGIPIHLYHRLPVATPVATPAAGRARSDGPARSTAPAQHGRPGGREPARALPPPPELVIPPADTADGFTWFVTSSDPEAPPAALPEGASLPATPALLPPDPASPTPTPTPTPEPAARTPVPAPSAPDPMPPSQVGLQRRVPGARLADGAAAPRPAAAGGPPQDAAAVRHALDGYQAAIASAADDRPPARPAVPAEVSGLTRRVPGANLAPGLRTATPPRQPAPAVPERDPDADRAAFDAFSAGFARAESVTSDPDAPDLEEPVQALSPPTSGPERAAVAAHRTASIERINGRNE